MLRNHGMEVVSFSTKRNLIFSCVLSCPGFCPGESHATPGSGGEFSAGDSDTNPPLVDSTSTADVVLLSYEKLVKRCRAL